MRGISLTWLLGLPTLTMLGMLGFLLRWPPPALWRGVFIVGAVYHGGVSVLGTLPRPDPSLTSPASKDHS